MTEPVWNHGRRTPGVTVETEEYWHGGAKGELRIQFCSACENWQHPPSPVCRLCRSRNALETRPVSGRGRVASWTQNEQPWFPGQQVPFRVGYVELEEQPGLYVFGGITGSGDAEDPMGRAITTRFQQQGSVWLPVFEVVGKDGAL